VIQALHLYSQQKEAARCANLAYTTNFSRVRGMRPTNTLLRAFERRSRWLRGPRGSARTERVRPTGGPSGSDPFFGTRTREGRAAQTHFSGPGRGPGFQLSAGPGGTRPVGSTATGDHQARSRLRPPPPRSRPEGSRRASTVRLEGDGRGRRIAELRRRGSGDHGPRP